MDISAIVETKLDSSFPESQFILPGMRKPFRLDVTSRKDGLLAFANNDIRSKYVNNDIPSKYLRSFHLPGDIQAIPLEINLKAIPLEIINDYFL